MYRIISDALVIRLFVILQWFMANLIKLLTPVSRLELVLGFIRTGIEPIFGILMILALKVLDLSLKSHINDPVLESFF